MIDFDWLAKAAGYKTEYEMWADYRSRGLGYRSCENILGISHGTVRNRMTKLGFETRPRGGANHVGIHANSFAAKIQQLDTQDMTAQQIRKRLGCSLGHVHSLASRFNLEYKKGVYNAS